ncbi:tripartite tricarboxylate transporter substrate-binding protein [Pigmentiphaga litoralis]|uniref:tripartite tricarboxylate transporter substrate-binding protein n=1 Tax=Pigmentiphaga litoralis TaxID=516702 RepID=UPI003B43517C
MRCTRRSFLGASAVLMSGLSPVRAAPPPSRLRLLVAGPAGGAVDVAARLAADQLKESGYVAIVESHAGAAGQIAVEMLARAPADGSTVLVTPPGVFTIFPHIYPRLPYRTADFSGVGTLCGYQFAIAVGPAVKADTLPGFLDWARSRPEQASYGTPGAGTEPHFIGTELERLSGVKLAHVPYRGGAQAINDLAGGHLPAVISAVPNLVAQHQAGKIRVLATTGSHRSDFLPNVPTIAEAGYPQITGNLFYGVFASARVPGETLAELSLTFARAAQATAFRDGLRRMSLEPMTLSRPDLAATMSAMSDKWAAVVKRSGFNPET